MDTIQTLGEVDCPACEAKTASFSFNKSSYPLFSCSTCEFLFVHPFPTDEQISDHYVSNYRGATADFYPKSGDRRWRGFIQSLKLFRYVVGKDVLDIGCGGGFMVEAFMRIGGRSSGLDISRNSIDYAEKHFPRGRFFCESFEDFRARRLTYDFVFSSEVFEHLRGPAEFMMTLAAVVRPGGFVYLSAPDAGHKKVPANIQEWGDICPPEHLQFFSLKNMRIVFERYGFKLHKVFKSGSPAHSVVFKRDAVVVG